MKIYVASSWRNEFQPAIVEMCQAEGHEVYDFRHPPTGSSGFHWSEIGEGWKNWTPKEYLKALQHPVAQQEFAANMAALWKCDLCILILPCGRSAHLELGYAIGAGKKTWIFHDHKSEPELMYLMADKIILTSSELLDELGRM